MNVPTNRLVRSLAGVTLGAVWILAVPRGMMGLALWLSLAILALCAFHARWRRAATRRLILEYPLPSFLRSKLREHYAHLDDAQAGEVERGLRQFFLASARAEGRFVAMPSKVVDALWHEFILYTRGYETFCRRAFGRLLHHTPAEALPAHSARTDKRSAGLRRAWFWSCREEGIDPRRPARLPLLFALDGLLAIPGGYKYVPDCTLLGANKGDTHCASSMGCGSSCGSSGSGGGDGGGCGGGD